MSNLQTWRVCVGCGREFFGYNNSKFCPVCKTDRTKETPPELADEKDGWRHMFRDRTGTVIVPGGNVMKALDDLCAYEEACEASRIRGPEELKAALEELGRLRTGDADCHGLRPRNDNGGDGGQGSGRPTKDSGTGWYDPHAKRPRWTQGKHCEGCGHYHPTIASGARGICDKHPRRIRPEGGKRGKYVVLDEPRQCQARRVACSDWEAKGAGRQQARTAPGPRRGPAGRDGELRSETQAMPLGGFAGATEDGGRQSAVPTDGSGPEWVGPSAELMPPEAGNGLPRAASGPRNDNKEDGGTHCAP